MFSYPFSIAKSIASLSILNLVKSFTAASPPKLFAQRKPTCKSLNDQNNTKT